MQKLETEQQNWIVRTPTPNEDKDWPKPTKDFYFISSVTEENNLKGKTENATVVAKGSDMAEHLDETTEDLPVTSDARLDLSNSKQEQKLTAEFTSCTINEVVHDLPSTIVDEESTHEHADECSFQVVQPDLTSVFPNSEPSLSDGYNATIPASEKTPKAENKVDGVKVSDLKSEFSSAINDTEKYPFECRGLNDHEAPQMVSVTVPSVKTISDTEARGSVLRTTSTSLVSISMIGECVADATQTISSTPNKIDPANCTTVASWKPNNLTGLFTNSLSVDKSFSLKCVPSFSKATSGNVIDVAMIGQSPVATVLTTPSIDRAASCASVNLLQATSSTVTSPIPPSATSDTHSNRTSFKSQTFTLPMMTTETESQANGVQDLTKETCTKQVPVLLELCVGGTHRYTTLLATITQAKAGYLAEMFLGKVPLPLHVMKDGAYFLDTDGESFQLIIEYLRDGRLPDMKTESMKGTSRSEELLLKSFHTARKYGLHEYVHELDQYFPIQRFKELEANKKIVEFYCKQMLWALNKNDLEQNAKFAILLKSSNSTLISAACCEHVCTFAPVDTVVHLTREFSLQILRLLCQRLRCLCYDVAAKEESCMFRCTTHAEGDTDKKECTSRRHLLVWCCRNLEDQQPC